MANFIMAEQNGRTIPKGDKIFSINKLAQDLAGKIGKENVINATIGSLLDDDGNLLVLPTVVDILRSLKPDEFADYAPIGGVPAFLESAKKAAFGNYSPEGYTEAIATPGGTGAIRSTIQNYSKRFDKVLTSDWHWSPYQTIASELERKIATFTMFDESGNFNIPSLDSKLSEILSGQDSLIFIFNAPAHNPTGFSPSLGDWDNVVGVLKEKAKDRSKKLILFVDIAYIDFAGDSDKCREFIPKLSNMPENILVIFGFSMSKGYTLYGMRSGASICLSRSKEIVEEFNMVSMYSNRGTWSNGTRPAMMTLSKIFQDDLLYKKVLAERKVFNYLLESRCKAFIETAKQVSLKTCPFDAGFFITVPCKKVDDISIRLQDSGIFTVPMDGGIRIAISAIKESDGRILATKLAEAINSID